MWRLRVPGARELAEDAARRAAQYSRPTEVACMSLGPDRVPAIGSRAALRPCAALSSDVRTLAGADLWCGYGRVPFAQKDEGRDEHIDALLLAVEDKPGADVACWRGMLVCIMCTPFVPSEEWAMNVQRHLDGTLCLEEDHVFKMAHRSCESHVTSQNTKRSRHDVEAVSEKNTEESKSSVAKSGAENAGCAPLVKTDDTSEQYNSQGNAPSNTAIADEKEGELVDGKTKPSHNITDNAVDVSTASREESESFASRLTDESQSGFQSRKRQRRSAGGDDARLAYGGHRFEQICTGEAGPHDAAPVDCRTEYDAVFRATLGGHRVLIGAEVDCCVPEDYGRAAAGSGAPVRYVELKTALHASQRGAFHRETRLMRWWCQSFLAGVETLLVGWRASPDSGVLRAAEALSVGAIPRSVRGAVRWDAQLLLQWGAQVLAWLRDAVPADGPRLCYSLRHEGGVLTLRVRSDGYSFVP